MFRSQATFALVGRSAVWLGLLSQTLARTVLPLLFVLLGFSYSRGVPASLNDGFDIGVSGLEGRAVVPYVCE